MNITAFARNNRSFLSILLSVILSLIFIALSTQAATTISTNVSTGGTLSVTGASTLTGNVTAAGTLSVTGLTTLIQASSTRFSVHDTAYFGGTATTTINSAGKVSVAVSTSTPSEELNVAGDALFETAATTTIKLHSSTANTGGCIEVKGTDNAVYRLYATAAGAAVWEAGACQ